jgi:hypothetical protein
MTQTDRKSETRVAIEGLELTWIPSARSLERLELREESVSTPQCSVLSEASESTF